MMTTEMEKRFSQLESKVQQIHDMVSRILKKTENGSADPAREILTTKQVAELLGVDVSVIYAYCYNGQLPHQREGRKYRFKRNEVMKWWQRQPKESEFSVENMAERYLQQNPLRG